jgi:hypothetical protein
MTVFAKEQMPYEWWLDVAITVQKHRPFKYYSPDVIRKAARAASHTRTRIAGCDEIERIFNAGELDPALWMWAAA